MLAGLAGPRLELVTKRIESDAAVPQGPPLLFGAGESRFNAFASAFTIVTGQRRTGRRIDVRFRLTDAQPNRFSCRQEDGRDAQKKTGEEPWISVARNHF